MSKQMKQINPDPRSPASPTVLPLYSACCIVLYTSVLQVHNTKKNKHRYIIVKLLKTKRKEKSLKEMEQ